MILQRLLILVALLAPGALGATPASASDSLQENCSRASTDGVVECSAGLDEPSIARIQTAQEMPQWCWAASVSMILGFHGQQVAQSQIVADRFGAVVDQPATSADDMTQALARPRAGGAAPPVVVTALTAASAPAGKTAPALHLNHQAVLDELRARRPMLIGTAGHAMVLVRVRYQRFANGAVRVMGGTIIDPLPGQGVRELASREMRVSYLAMVREAATVIALAGTR